ncbi:hypothetical protein GCM10010238_33790 [Streptomyces griseoviridis]|uniref:Uncharacterized protein n=1 Tax=Streptomyces griseoviridis TaxID=45398 RepID=A0A918GKK0_STRGD|nr:hypothetical protein GCM10010238_33790 [Streptomyces niveoruber]
MTETTGAGTVTGWEPDGWDSDMEVPFEHADEGDAEARLGGGGARPA